MKAISARNTIMLIINNKLIYYDSSFKNGECKYDKKLKSTIKTNFFYIINNNMITNIIKYIFNRVTIKKSFSYNSMIRTIKQNVFNG